MYIRIYVHSIIILNSLGVHYSKSFTTSHSNGCNYMSAHVCVFGIVSIFYYKVGTAHDSLATCPRIERVNTIKKSFAIVPPPCLL